MIRTNKRHIEQKDCTSFNRDARNALRLSAKSYSGADEMSKPWIKDIADQALLHSAFTSYPPLAATAGNAAASESTVTSTRWLPKEKPVRPL